MPGTRPPVVTPAPHSRAAATQLPREELPEVPPLVDASQLQDLLPLVSVRRHAGGQVVITEGDDADECFIILDGEVDVLKSRPDGHRVTATVRAAEGGDVEVVVTGRAAFDA